VSHSLWHKGSSLIHWNYFLTLDADTATLSRYVEFREDNFNSYSVEMARILLAAASEVDVVAKMLCKNIDPTSKSCKINHYRNEITHAFPAVSSMAATIPRYALTLHPWDNWTQNETPVWWHDYNAVKHERNANFQRANLKNTLNSVGALFIILLHLYRDKARSGDLLPLPILFGIGEEHVRAVDLSRGTLSIIYKV
jgi:hypothetical protein